MTRTFLAEHPLILIMATTFAVMAAGFVIASIIGALLESLSFNFNDGPPWG
jgi:hypothetical protein